MCREGAWAELAVKVTSVSAFRGAARVNKVISGHSLREWLFFYVAISDNAGEENELTLTEAMAGL